MENNASLYKGLLKTFSTISLQRKLLLFVVIALSMIFTLSGVFIYKLVNDTFLQSEKKHIEIISETLSSKVSVWYFINKNNEQLNMDEFLKSMLADYHLENITFKDNHGKLISAVESADYIPNDPYNIKYEKAVYAPDLRHSHDRIGTLQIVYAQHMLKQLSMKYYTVGVILVTLLTLYFYLEMRLLKELLTPLRKIASEIKGYMPGDKLVFDSFSTQKDDVISEIVNGFLHMQQNIDEAMEKKEIEKENNRIKDAILMKQSRFIEMGTMINNIAHQWKQPLNIVELCITDLTVKSMMGTVDPKYQKKLFTDMHNQVEYMSRTIDIFKNFLDDDQNDRKMEVFTIKKAITDTMQLLGSTLDKKNVSITFNLDEDATTYGSISEIEQVLLIIINNAIDANSNKITIESTKEKKGNILKIYDNGGGFSPEIIDRVFDAYFTTKHQSQGTGLGLFIAKMIVEIKLNGTIEAHNFNDGALFVIKLPFPPTSS